MTKLAFLLGLVSSVALAQNCPTRASWPTGDWPKEPVNATAKAAEIKALEDFAFTLEGKDADRLGYRTDGLVIIKKGVIVYERYGRGFDETKRHISWSVAKSFSSAFVGVAVKDAGLDLTDSICKYLTEFEGTPQCAISVKDTITFGTGLDWAEGYENSAYNTSSILPMLFGSGHRDVLKHILSHRFAAEPGKRWKYSTGDAGLAASVAKRALAKGHGPDAFWTLLFDVIGMSKATFEMDIKGEPLGGMMVYATPRDFAKFGFLFLNDGCWNGQRIVPEGWVAASTTPSDIFVASAPDDQDTPSGYAWWLNRAVKDRPKPWPDVPDGAYMADGHWGQTIFVIPSEDVIIVRTGDDRNSKLPWNDLGKLSLAVAK